MKRGVGFVVYVLTFFLGSSESVAVFRFANIYGHHMVLQQAPKRATVWGFGEVGQKVTVTIGRELYCSGIQPGKVNLLRSFVPSKKFVLESQSQLQECRASSG